MALNNSMNAPATLYNLIVGNGAGYAAIAPSATTGIALVSAGAAANPQYSTVVVAGGGSGLSSLTAYALLAGGTTTTGNMQQVSGLGSAGQVLTSAGAGALPAWGDVPVADIPWTVITAATQTLAVDNAYIANAASGGVAFTLPATAAVGSVMRIAGLAAGSGWSIAQNASQDIQFGSAISTAGVTGSVASTDNGDVVEIVCAVADTNFIILNAVGNLDIV